MVCNRLKLGPNNSTGPWTIGPELKKRRKGGKEIIEKIPQKILWDKRESRTWSQSSFPNPPWIFCTRRTQLLRTRMTIHGQKQNQHRLHWSDLDLNALLSFRNPSLSFLADTYPRESDLSSPPPLLLPFRIRPPLHLLVLAFSFFAHVYCFQHMDLYTVSYHDIDPQGLANWKCFSYSLLIVKKIIKHQWMGMQLSLREREEECWPNTVFCHGI